MNAIGTSIGSSTTGTRDASHSGGWPRHSLLLLWLREHRAAREDGSKDRPCAIILVTKDRDGETDVLVVPVTHSPPGKDVAALEMPPALKRHLRMDAERSWVIYSESNVFTWPGPDLRHAGGRGSDTIAYGMLPPRFFAELKRRFLALEVAAGGERVLRSE